MKKKIVPKLRQEVKVKADIVTSDDTKIYYTGKFQDFTARYIINELKLSFGCRKCEDNEKSRPIFESGCDTKPPFIRTSTIRICLYRYLILQVVHCMHCS